MLEIVTTTRVVLRSLGGLKIFGEKNLGKCTMYIGVKVISRFNTTPLILLLKLKIILI